MSERKIYEIAKLMNDRANIENDMASAMEMVTGLFRDKYVKRLNDAFIKCREGCAKNPSKEVQLLQALKPFMPENNHENLESAAQMIILMETLSNIKSEANTINAAEIKAQEKAQVKENKTENGRRVVSAANVDNSARKDKAIHPDGIYEMDMNCMVRRAGGMPTNMMNIVLAGMLMGSLEK